MTSTTWPNQAQLYLRAPQSQGTSNLYLDQEREQIPRIQISLEAQLSLEQPPTQEIFQGYVYCRLETKRRADTSQNPQDTSGGEVLTGTGDALPSQVDSKRLHAVPGGVTHDPKAKGSTRYTNHTAQQSEFETGASEGPQTTNAPGDEGLSNEEAMDKIEKKE